MSSLLIVFIKTNDWFEKLITKTKDFMLLRRVNVKK